MEIYKKHHFSCKDVHSIYDTHLFLEKFRILGLKKIWRKVWRSMEKYEINFHSILKKYGVFSKSMEKYGEVWRSMEKCGEVWRSMEKYGVFSSRGLL